MTTATIDSDEGTASTRRGALLGLGALIAAAGATALPETADAAPAAAAPHAGRQYPSASAAARAAGGARSSVFPHDPAAHLLRRATFGPRPKDVQDLKRLGIDGWLDRQLHPSTIPDPRGDAAQAVFPLFGASPERIQHAGKDKGWDAMMDAAQGSLARQVFSDRQVYEITVDVMANHLHVPIPGEQALTVPSYLHDVIRKHAFGRFDDMLHAAMRHPAMLNFLNNDLSVKANVNENLGRELLELHTVGLAAKYSEPMVRASAKILSGRTWDWKTGKYQFDSLAHATGRVTVLGFTAANHNPVGGEKVGDDYLHYLAHHPDTARHIAQKIATRFVSDEPSPSLVNRLAHVYLSSGTDIRAVVGAVFRSSDFWAAVGVRMRRPLEDAVGALRVLDARTAGKMKDAIGALFWNLNNANHTPHGWQPPNGYPDVAVAWLGAGAMIQRWSLHRALVYGWWKQLGWTPPSKLVGWKHGMSTLEWTRLLAHRLLGLTPSQRHLAAVISGAGLKPTDPAPSDDWRCGKVAALLLDSPYFQLR